MIESRLKDAADKTLRRLATRLLAAGALLLAFAPMGRALEPSTPLASYGRQAWGMENGLPQNTVQALVQTRDGFIWVGTEVGLVRFDGNSFTVFDKNSTPALPGNDVRCLLEAPDGALWIGTSEGLARWKDGSLKAFTAKDGLPGNGIRALARGTNGAVVVSTNDGDVSFTWTGGDIGIGGWNVRLIQSEKLQDPTPTPGTRLSDGSHALVNKGTVELTQNGHTQRWAFGHDLSGNRVQTLFTDREGSLWIGTNGGLARWALGKLQRLPITDPLATASVLTLMEDHEGNLWVGTETGGLHILRDQRFHTVGAREGLSSDGTTTMVEDRAGTLWVGTSGGGLNALRRDGATNGVSRIPRSENPDLGHPQSGAIKSYSVRDGLLSDVILSLAAASNGDLWVGTPDGLNRIRSSQGGKPQIDGFTSADGLPDDFIRSLLADSDGSLWIGTRRGLTHWTGSLGSPTAHMQTFTQANGLGSDLVGAMARDSSGDLWVATLAGLSRLDAGKIVNYTTANGLSSNVVTALLPHGNGSLLIGTQDHGWNLWDGQKFSAAMNKELAQTTIHAILDDAHGHLWFATGNGIARCDCDAMSGKMQGASCSHWVEFGPADGLRSRETATNSHPSAWRSRDGHLWFATPKGLVEVDPAHFPVNEVVPPVALERFAVDDLAQALHGAETSLLVQAGHVHFQFDYAGLSFTAPQKVRYRFILEGFDKGWTEAGTRRSAYYTNIPPGRYTFRVQAANNDGLWNTEGAALVFRLRPHFYQTIWFYALLVALVAGVIVLLLRLRLQRAEGEFRAVLGERSRIAREIHDTLAQGYVGVSVQLEVLSELLRMNKPEAAAKQLDLARGYVREGLADARQSIWALRTQDSGETTLPVKIRRLVEAEDGHGLTATFSIFGAYRPLPPGSEMEILRVAQEAIHNVKKHADASQLTVQLEYGQARVALEIRDNGRGFTPGEDGDSPTGHFGLTGMRERAAAIGGKLEVTSEPGVGTTVRLEAAAIAVRERQGDE